MTKSLYSLILSDEVVKRIDDAAEASGTNRSNLINQILADYVSYTTPEMKIRQIFESIASLLSSTSLQLSGDNSGRNFSIKSSLDYKYKPTLTYSVELYRTEQDSIGELKVLYRIHSQELLYKIESFFETLVAIEKKYLSSPVVYSMFEEKFIRTFVIPNGKNYSHDEIARGISDYIRFFDSMLKKFLLGKYESTLQMEYDFKLYIAKSILL